MHNFRIDDTVFKTNFNYVESPALDVAAIFVIHARRGRWCLPPVSRHHKYLILL